MDSNVLQSIGTLVFLAMPVGAISMTLAKAEIFEPVRNAINRRSQWLGKLVKCPYCTSHYVSMLVVVFFAPKMIPDLNAFLNFVFTTFAMVTLASFWAGLIYRAYAVME